jgi:hypothetical protein
MRATRSVIAVLTGFVSDQPTEITPAARKRLTNLSARARLPQLKVEFKIFFVIAVVSIVSACTSWQAQENTLSQISTLEQMRYAQLLTNLSNEIDRIDSIPSLGVTSSGTATTGTTGSIGTIFTNPFDLGHNTKTLSPTIMGNWQNNWTITPISDPVDLTNLRALYGLLYRNDYEISQIIAETLVLYSTYQNPCGTIPNNGNICYPWIQGQRDACGITWKISDVDPKINFLNAMKPDAKYGDRIVGFTINDPRRAMIAYLTALNAFPDTTTTSGSNPSSLPISISIPHLPPPSTSVPINVSVTAPSSSQQPTGASSKPPPEAGCYGKGPSPQAVGIVTGYLAQQYGLLYPTKDMVFTSLRNGLSPNCRSYQLRNLKERPDSTRMLPDRLFERSLFWQDSRGKWQPEYELPPDVFGDDGQPRSGLPREKWDHLDRFRSYDFWTTASACVSDFIILGINATANSHAAAQNAPKGGTTPASLGGS